MNLIAISGKAQSGKDVIAKMIQILTGDNDKYKKILLEGRELEIKALLNDYKYFKSDWSIQKFASPLKEMAAILFDVELADFEYNEFKESKLNELWKLVKLSVNNEEFLFSSKEQCNLIKRVCERKKIDYTYAEKSMTYREALIKIGDALRSKFHPLVFVNSLFQRLQRDGNYIISDLRYMNEAEFLSARNAHLLRVNSERATIIDHKSETSLDNYPFSNTITNNRGFKELAQEVYSYLLQRKIITKDEVVRV